MLVEYTPATRDRTPLDARIAAIATRQHGLISIVQLCVLGLSHSAVSRRVARGVLHRVGRGVYAVGHAALSREGRWLAGVLGGGEGAVLGRLSAASLCEVSRFREQRVEVISTHRRRSRPGVAFHHTRTLSARDVTSHRQIPVTSMARTFVDLTDVLTPHQLTNVIHESAFRGRFVEAAARDAMARSNGRHRLAVLERAIELYRAGGAGTRSGAEDAFLVLVDSDEPLVNAGLLGYEVDFHWPERRLAVEIDGPGHGRAPTARVDMQRAATLTAAGYTVLRFTDEDIYARPGLVLDRLRKEGVRC